MARKALQAGAGGVGQQFGQEQGGTVGGLLGGAAGLAVGGGLRNVREGNVFGKDKPVTPGPDLADKTVADIHTPPSQHPVSGAVTPGVTLTPDDQVKIVSDDLHRTTTAETAVEIGLEQKADAAKKALPRVERPAPPPDETGAISSKKPGYYTAAEVHERVNAASENDPVVLASMSPKERTQIAAYRKEHIEPLEKINSKLHEDLRKAGAPVEETEGMPGYFPRTRKVSKPARALFSSTSSEPYGRTEGGRRLVREPASEKDRIYFAAERPAASPPANVTNPLAYARTQAATGHSPPPPTRRLVFKDDEGYHYVDKPDELFHPDDKIVHAYTREIEAANLKDARGRPVKYDKDPVASLVKGIAEKQKALTGIKTKNQLLQSGLFKDIGARDAPEHWIPTKNPEFRGKVMEPRIAHALEDFGGPDYQSWVRGIAAGNRYMQRALFWSPVVHILNVAGHAFTSRGWNNFNPAAYPGIAKAGWQAAREVWTQGSLYREFLNEGGALIRGGLNENGLYERVLNKFGQQMERDPSRWDPIARVAGFTGIPQMVKALYGASSRALWATGDMLMMQRVIELKQTGMSTRAAIAEIERHVPNYRIPDKVLNSRMLSEALQSGIFQFARYKYGQFASWGRLAKDLTGLGKTGSSAEQIQAAGQLLATGLMAGAVWDVINPWLSGKTKKGNMEDSFSSFGPLTPLNHVRRMLNGTGDMNDLVQSAFELGPAVKGAIEVWSNRDLYLGKHVRTWSADQTALYNITRQAAQVVDHLVRLGVQPIQQVNGAWEDKTTGEKMPDRLAAAVKRAGLSGVGIYRGKDDAARRADHLKYGNMDFKAGEKHKGFGVESGMDYLENAISARVKPKTQPGGWGDQ
jgi:hypothetical protein